MSYLLHIETSSTNCSVALSQGEKLIHCVEKNAADFRHSDFLHIFIEQLMTESEIAFQQLEGVVVSKGPGSYTGLRIGVSTAKGICYGQDIPLLSVNSLEVLVNQCTPKENDLIVPLIDARRMEVFAMVLNSDKEVLKPTFATIIDESSFQEYTEENRLVFLGTGVEKCKQVLTRKNSIYLDEIRVPSSKEMISLAHFKFLNKEFEDLAYFEPFYLKEFYTSN